MAKSPMEAHRSNQLAISLDHVKNNLQDLGKATQMIAKPIADKLAQVHEISQKATKAGREGALISLAFASLIYPMATISATQRIHGISAGAAVQSLRQGGIGRFYTGAAPSALGLMMGRFCDAAGDMAVSELFNKKAPQLNTPLNCAILGALAASALYFPLIPVETLAVTARAGGQEGVKKLGAMAMQK